MQFIPCAFVNTTEPPLSKKPWAGFFVQESHDREQSLSLYGSRDLVYKHPDVPEEAVLQVYQQEHLLTAKQGSPEYPILYLLLQAQKAAEALVKGK